jgi:hypothetical protein
MLIDPGASEFVITGRRIVLQVLKLIKSFDQQWEEHGEFNFGRHQKRHLDPQQASLLCTLLW